MGRHVHWLPRPIRQWVTWLRPETPGLSLLAAVCLSPISAIATEYFVSPQGLDTADGLAKSSAFSSIGRTIERLIPGDTLTILPGTYFEAIKASVSGTQEAPITIRAQRPGTVLLRGNVEVGDFKPVPNHPYVYSTPFRQRVE